MSPRCVARDRYAGPVDTADGISEETPEDSIRPSVVFVVGWERSGTTLLGNILGLSAGAFHVGELSQLWNRARKSDLCGCGRPLTECQFWAEVVMLLPEDPLSRPGDEVGELRDRFASLRRTWPMLLGLRSRRQQRLLGEFSGLLEGAYRAVGTATKASLIIDISKVPAMIPALDLMTELDVTFVHLIRDSRAVVHSGTRGRYEDMRRGVLENAARWVLWNLAAEGFRRRSRRPWLRLRYEDLSADPAGAVAEIARVVPALRDFDLTDHLVGERLMFTENHTVQGIAPRFKKGSVRIQTDDEWITDLSFGRWLLTTMLTFWMLPMYGYRLSRRRLARMAAQS